MHTYQIKQNGYTVATASGKNKAYALVSELCRQEDIEGTWEKVSGEYRFHYVKDNIEGHFTIEQAHRGGEE